MSALYRKVAYVNAVKYTGVNQGECVAFAPEYAFPNGTRNVDITPMKGGDKIPLAANYWILADPETDWFCVYNDAYFNRHYELA